MDNKFAATIGIVFGAGALAFGFAVVTIFPVLPVASAWCIAVMGIVLMISSVIAILKPSWFQKNDRKSTAVIKAPELTIIVGHDAPYIETSESNDHNILRMVLIGIKNTGGMRLTNCKVSFDARDRKTDKLETWVRDGPFSLDIDEERRITLACFNEPVPPNPATWDWINLQAPPSGTFWSAPMLSATGGVVTINAESAESRPCEVICKLWVKGGKLNWEKA